MSLVGKTIGPYRVRALVGQGAMAAVYRAEHAVLGREVALKVPHMSARVMSTDIARFRREGRLLASIQHPGVVEILDADEIDDVPFLAMTFIEAPTLETVLAACPDGKLTEKRAVAIASSLCEAMEAVHKAGVLHRDLKPSNVFIELADRAILTDFGVARPVGEHTMITADGAAVGTFLYMAPEQHLEQPVDARTDLYAVGLLMYRMLCGRMPFEGNLMEVMDAKCEGDALDSPRTLAPEVSTGVEAILRRACARRPEERFASAAEFRAALTALAARPANAASNSRKNSLPRKPGLITGDLPAQAKRTARPRRVPLIAIAVMGAFVVGALIAMVLVRKGESDAAWVALPDADGHASPRPSVSPSASAESAPRPAPLRTRPANAPLDLAAAQAQLAALWPGYAPSAFEADLTRFPLKVKGNPPNRERDARELLVRLGSLLGPKDMQALAERSLIFPAFLPYMVPGAKAPAIDSAKLTGGGSEGFLDEPLYNVVGKSSPQTALVMFLAATARVVDFMVHLRTGRRPPDGVTQVDVLAFVGYLAMTQPGLHQRTGESIYGLFKPAQEGERVSYESGDVEKVGERMRRIDAIGRAHFAR